VIFLGRSLSLAVAAWAALMFFSTPTFAQSMQETSTAFRAAKNISKVYADEGMIGVQEAVNRCYARAKKLRTENSALYCYVLHSAASQWSRDWHAARGMQPLSYTTEADVNGRIYALFDLLKFDSNTRQEKLSAWGSIASKAAAELAAGCLRC